MLKIKQKTIGFILCSLLFIGVKITNAQTTSMRLMETIEIDFISQEVSCSYFNGNLLILGKLDGTIELWNYKDNNKIRTFIGHSAKITAVTINKNETYIASASEDNTIKLWWIESDKEIYSFNRDNSIIVLITALILNDESNILVSIDEYNNINTWNTNGLIYKHIKTANTEDEKFDNKLPGSNIYIEDAIKKSMIVPISETTEIKYQKAIIAKCVAIEEPTEPGQIIVETCYYYHKFKVTEIISGVIDNEFVCDYKTFLSEKEQIIKKDNTFILILQDGKAYGKYHLIKALYDTEISREKIKSSIEKLSYLIKKK
ncbi:MAG: hypothetical protein KAT68_14065 [Bacteroidales bacterium]|nr:hypothetical protein [Bacteroidales bacterium]